jgi:hypothetical protein
LDRFGSAFLSAIALPGDSNLKASISWVSFRENVRCVLFRVSYLPATDDRFADSEPWMVGDSNDAMESSAMLG